jgi:hypothetical protein
MAKRIWTTVQLRPVHKSQDVVAITEEFDRLVKGVRDWATDLIPDPASQDLVLGRSAVLRSAGAAYVFQVRQMQLNVPPQGPDPVTTPPEYDTATEKLEVALQSFLREVKEAVTFEAQRIADNVPLSTTSNSSPRIAATPASAPSPAPALPPPTLSLPALPPAEPVAAASETKPLALPSPLPKITRTQSAITSTIISEQVQTLNSCATQIERAIPLEGELHETEFLRAVRVILSVIGRAIDLLSATGNNSVLERDLTLWLLSFAAIAKEIIPPKKKDRAHTDPVQLHAQLIANRDRLMAEVTNGAQLLQLQ